VLDCLWYFDSKFVRALEVTRVKFCNDVVALLQGKRYPSGKGRLRDKFVANDVFG
jgi:hypothetical protein